MSVDRFGAWDREDVDRWREGIYDRLGKEPDAVIARDLGLSRQRVRQIRFRAGISRCEQAREGKSPKFPTKLDNLLGKMTDQALADALKIPAWVVGRHRRELGIRSFGDKNYNSKEGIVELPGWLKPYEKELGVRSDMEIERMCGMSQSTIARWRRRLGIPALRSKDWPKPGSVNRKNKGERS